MRIQTFNVTNDAIVMSQVGFIFNALLYPLRDCGCAFIADLMIVYEAH